MILDRIFGAAGVRSSRPQVSFYSPSRSIAGVNMTEETALTYSAVWAAVKVISETVAMLPWRLYREDRDSRELLAGAPVDVLLHRRPNPDMTAFVFREYLMSCALLWGNGYAVIWRDISRRPYELWPLHPRNVEPRRENDGPLFYRVQLDDAGAFVDIPATDMLHVRGPTVDGIVGRSVISLARDSWGLGLAAEQFGAAFFGNGATPALVIHQTDYDEAKSPELGAEAVANMLQSFDRKHRGPSSAGKTAFLEYGLDVKPVGIPQKDAQFIETRQHSVADVARWFRLPPHKIGDLSRATFGNIEHQSIEFVTDSIQPWLERLEQEADTKLVTGPGRATRFTVNALLRGDAKARAEFYTRMRDLGALNINEIRRLEDFNPIEGGDLRLVPVNMMSIERARQGGATDQSGALRAVVMDAHERMARKERRALLRVVKAGRDPVEWSASFYEEHAEQMVQALSKPAAALAAHVGADHDVVDSIVEAHVERFVEASIADIVNGACSGWGERAEKETDRLIGRIVGAVADV